MANKAVRVVRLIGGRTLFAGQGILAQRENECQANLLFSIPLLI
jgi:hypothetical protein